MVARTRISTSSDVPHWHEVERFASVKVFQIPLSLTKNEFLGEHLPYNASDDRDDIEKVWSNTK